MGSSKVKEESATNGDTAVADVPPSNSCSFSEGEKVFAYHGPCIYGAKVQKVEIGEQENRYFVHYLGWNKNWDEWVGADRLLKVTEENVQLKNVLLKKQGMDSKTQKGRSTHTKPKSSTDAKVDKEDLKNFVAKGKKRKIESAVEKDNSALENLVKIQIPMSLKKQLLDDWQFVNQQETLVKLPRSPSVDDILTKYLDFMSNKEGKMTDSVGEILKGLRSYFDKAMPMMLLYKGERQQFHEAVKENVSPSSIYGAEHLLRLFVKLPELLTFVNIEEDTLIHLQQKLLDFLRFLQKNQSSFFLSAYDVPKGSEGSSD